MPTIDVKIKKGGKIEMDYMGFPGSSCEQAEEDLKDRLKALKLEHEEKEPKPDELLQEEHEFE